MRGLRTGARDCQAWAMLFFFRTVSIRVELQKLAPGRTALAFRRIRKDPETQKAPCSGFKLSLLYRGIGSALWVGQMAE